MPRMPRRKVKKQKVHLIAYDHPATWTVCNKSSVQNWKWGTYRMTEFHDRVTCKNCKKKIAKGTRGACMPTVFNRSY